MAIYEHVVTKYVVFRNDARQSIAAGCEWSIAFLFDAYLWTLVFDLFPAINTGAHPNKTHFSHIPNGMSMGQGTSMGEVEKTAVAGNGLLPALNRV